MSRPRHQRDKHMLAALGFIRSRSPLIAKSGHILRSLTEYGELVGPYERRRKALQHALRELQLDGLVTQIRRGSYVPADRAPAYTRSQRFVPKSSAWNKPLSAARSETVGSVPGSLPRPSGSPDSNQRSKHETRRLA